MSIKYKSARAIAFSAFFVLTMGAGSAYAATIGIFGSAPVACPDIVPYCPYGGHAVTESNGCTQTVCNSAPVAASSASMTAMPTSLSFTASESAINNPLPANSVLTITNVPSGIATAVTYISPSGDSSWGAGGWLSVSSPTQFASTSAAVTVSVQPWNAKGGLDAGTYTASIQIISNEHAIYVPVTLTVTAPTPTATNSPSITIASPSAGAQVPAGSSLTVNYSTSGSFSTPGGIYFVYLKEKPDQLLGNNSVSNTYDPLIFRASSLPYPLMVTMPTVADGWSGPAYLEIDYTDNSANVIASATSGEFTITNPDSQNPGSSPSGYSALSSFTASPNSIASGQMVAVNYAGTNLSTVNLSVTCPFGVSSPDGHGGDSCGRTSTFADGANSTQLQFINSDQGSQQVEITLSAYNASDSLVGTKSAYVTVGSANASMTPGAGVPSGTSNTGSSAQTAIRQQLVQLIALLLQLLQQSGAQGLVSPSQLNSILGTTSN